MTFDSVIARLRRYLDRRHDEKLMDRFGGIQRCPWCRQIVQNFTGTKFECCEEDEELDRLTCGNCGGTSLWLFAMGMHLHRALSVPEPEKMATATTNTHDEKLRRSLANVAKSLASRPPELRGPFESSATKPLELLDPTDDEAIEWVTKNLSGVRRDSGVIEYTLGAVVRAFQAGKSSGLATWCDVAEAAATWRQARRAVVNMPITDPEYLTRFHALADAEDRLNTAVAASNEVNGNDL
jgi:hypothetical protein